MKKVKRLTKEQFRDAMMEIKADGDAETRHMEADELLCSQLRALGYGEGIDVFQSETFVKWYS